MKKRAKLLPKLSKTVQSVMDLTFYTKAPMWYNNFAENLAIIRKGKDVKELPRLDGKPCICLGAGPSVWKHNHLELLKKWKGMILCCDRMLIECLKRGIVPFAVATVDGDKRIKEFYDDPIVDKYKDQVKAVFSAVTVHPEVVRRCPFEKYWFVPIYDDPRKPKSLTFALYYLSGEKSLLVTGGTVGSFIFNLAYFLGCNPIILVGYDYSYDAETPPEKTPYWFAYLQLCKWNYEKAKKLFVIGENPYFKTKYMLDLMFKVYREILAFYLKQLPKNIQVINATEGGSLHKPEVRVRCLKLREVIESFQKNIKE